MRNTILILLIMLTVMVGLWITTLTDNVPARERIIKYEILTDTWYYWEDPRPCGSLDNPCKGAPEDFPYPDYPTE